MLFRDQDSLTPGGVILDDSLKQIVPNVRTFRALVISDVGWQNKPGWYGDFNKTFKCHSHGFIRLRNTSNEMRISVDYADNCNDGVSF